MRTPKKPAITGTMNAYIGGPPGTWVSQEVASHAVDVDAGTISKWKKKGKLVVWDGKVNLDTVKELARSRGPNAKKKIKEQNDVIRRW